MPRYVIEVEKSKPQKAPTSLIVVDADNEKQAKEKAVRNFMASSIISIAELKPCHS